MSAGLFGFLGYDTVRLMEEIGPPPPDVLGVPDALLMRPRIVAVFDSVRDELTVVTPVRPEPGVSASQAWDRAVDRLTEVVEALDRPLVHAPQEADVALSADIVSNTAPAEYKAMVARAKEYIAAGDIFQVVLSQRFEAPFPLPAFSLYRALRRVNPSPFLYFLDFGGFSIVGSSPEILVRVRAGEVTIRPIAGTRRRGATPAEDRRLGEELLADPKERAEHLMLLDLGRNDVGRVADARLGEGDGAVLPRALQPRHAHRLQRRRLAPPGLRCARRAGRGLPRRHCLRRAEGARHADHRRAGEGQARPLCRLRRLFLPPTARWTPASCCGPRW